MAPCPSTAYEGCQAPLICWEEIWEPFHVGFEPQPLHNGVICSPAENHIFRRLPNSYLNWPDDGFICPSTAYEHCQPPCICWEEIWEPFQVGFEPQPLHNGVNCRPAVNHIISEDSQIWDNSSGGNGQNMAPYAHPQHMKVVKHLSYVERRYCNHSMLG